MIHFNGIDYYTIDDLITPTGYTRNYLRNIVPIYPSIYLKGYGKKSFYPQEVYERMKAEIINGDAYSKWKQSKRLSKKPKPDHLQALVKAMMHRYNDF